MLLPWHPACKPGHDCARESWFRRSLPALEQDVQLAKDTLAEAGYADKDGDGFVEDLNGNPIDLRITVQTGTRPEMYSRVAEVMIED